MANKSSLAVIEGPNGKAELFEVTEEGASIQAEYIVEFKGEAKKFLTMGEAYIEAGEMAGTPT